MTTLKNYSFSVALLLVATLLPSCTNDPYFEKAPTYVAYKDAPASILNRAYISGTSMRVLAGMRLHHTTTPTTRDERIALSEREIFRAKNILSSSRKSAAAHYLKAAETLWPIVKNTRYPHNKVYWGDKKRLLIAHQIYTHAVGQTARHLVSTKAISPHQKTLQLGDSTLIINTTSPHTIHPSYFDHINPLDTYTYANIGTTHYKMSGLGAATNGHRNWSAARAKANPIMPPYGMDMPINAIIDYPKPGQPRLTLTNLLKTDTINITGETRPLSADYSASIAALMDNQSSHLGLMIAINPKKYTQEKGLFALGPYDPDKIPVIFVHGLISQPATWTITSNHLLHDKTIRENYQFYYYFYPTGVTPVLSGAKFRQTLLEFYKRHNHEAHDKMNRTVLIGHSMGGILSSIQSREFNQQLWDSIFKKSTPSKKGEDPLKVYRSLFNPPILTPIERTIFVATPHRGSKLANGWIGGIGTALITLPKNILSLQVGATLDSMTDLGRSMITTDGRPNSISRLKPDNPTLTLLNKQPISSRVTYHTIMGDRGKNDSPDSSDGIVPYWSSHLDGAASEKVVPTDHEAQLHPMANDEISRILHLHLKAKK